MFLTTKHAGLPNIFASEIRALGGELDVDD